MRRIDEGLSRSRGRAPELSERITSELTRACAVSEGRREGPQRCAASFVFVTAGTGVFERKCGGYEKNASGAFRAGRVPAEMRGMRCRGGIVLSSVRACLRLPCDGSHAALGEYIILK